MTAEHVESATRCGTVAIVGRPNVGKSTLLNHILGQKISITSRRPQTTRYRILGIKTEGHVQAIYVDTPGFHSGSRQALNRLMNNTVLSTVREVDVILFVVEALRWRGEDQLILSRLAKLSVPIILAINKVDLIRDKTALLAFIDELRHKGTFEQVVPLSARKQAQVQLLEKEVAHLLPSAGFYYPEDQVTDRSERFLCAELIREKLMRSLGQELPYQIAVDIENFSLSGNIVKLFAVIWIERPAHRAIVIGKNGERLKKVGIQARQDIERLLGRKAFLELHVRVRKGWTKSDATLRSLGYAD